MTPQSVNEQPAVAGAQAPSGPPRSAAAILAAVRALPVSSWRYDHEEGSPLHIGPMAQDFHAAFGLGGSDREIAVVDLCGVLMVAVQQLSYEVEVLSDRLAAAEGGASSLG